MLYLNQTFCVRILRLKLLRLSEFCWEAIQVFLNLNHIKVLSIFVELNFNFHSLKKVNQNWKWIKDRLPSYILFVLIIWCFVQNINFKRQEVNWDLIKEENRTFGFYFLLCIGFRNFAAFNWILAFLVIFDKCIAKLIFFCQWWQLIPFLFKVFQHQTTLMLIIKT